MNQELRLYTFVNFYLSSIQQGIQSAHVTHSLFVKYPSAESNSLLWDWATNDKTMIVLNGGAGPDIIGAFQEISNLDIHHNDVVPLPIECFYEDASLNNMMTAFGVVVPSCFYDARKVSDDDMRNVGVTLQTAWRDAWVFAPDCDKLVVYRVGTPAHRFITLLKSCGLAK